MTHILLHCAIEEEARPLLLWLEKAFGLSLAMPALGDFSTGEITAKRKGTAHRAAQKINRTPPLPRLSLVITGIGRLPAVQATTRAIEHLTLQASATQPHQDTRPTPCQNAPQAIITFGVLAALDGNAPLVQSYLPHSFTAIDTGYHGADGFKPLLPGAMPWDETSPALPANAALFSGAKTALTQHNIAFHNAPHVTTDSFLANPQRAAELHREGFASLDMEVASIAYLAKHYGLPYLCLKVSTDHAGGGAPDTFMRNLPLAAEKAAYETSLILAHLLRA